MSVVFLGGHIFFAVGCGGEDTDRKPDNGTEVGGVFLRLNALSAFLRVLGSAVDYTASFQNTAQTSSDSATADTAAAIIIFNIFRRSFSIVPSNVSVWIYNKKVDKYDKIEDRKRRNKKCLQKIRNTPRNISKQ